MHSSNVKMLWTVGNIVGIRSPTWTKNKTQAYQVSVRFRTVVIHEKNAIATQISLLAKVR